MAYFPSKITNDGSLTFFSAEFDELFHSHSGAKQEAEQKFVEPCQFAQKAHHQPLLKIIDICYGLGYNSASAIESIGNVNPHCVVELIALEIDETVPRQAVREQLLHQWRDPIPAYLTELATQHRVQTDRFKGQLWLDDARNSLKKLNNMGWLADAIFLDPFSPPKCPQLWTVEFLHLVARCLKPDGRLATYSCAGAVRKGLQLAGLTLGSTVGVGRRSPGTVATFSPTELPPLSLKEQEYLQTRASIPYRDPHLNATAKDILQRRQAEQQASLLESTSQWKKRWSKMLSSSDYHII